MNRKSIILGEDILTQYKQTTIGYILVSRLEKLSQVIHPEEITNLPFTAIRTYGLSLQNLVDFSTIKKWRELYAVSGVKPKTYKSSVESLLRRFLEGVYKPITPVVDLYNYVSAGSIIPIGGYDWQAIDGELKLRFSRTDEGFIPLNGRMVMPVTSRHIVYADENEVDSIVCWMWNQKDSKRTMLTNSSSEGLFIFDCISEQDVSRLKDAMESFEEIVLQYGAGISSRGILNEAYPIVSL